MDASSPIKVIDAEYAVNEIYKLSNNSLIDIGCRVFRVGVGCFRATRLGRRACCWKAKQIGVFHLYSVEYNESNDEVKPLTAFVNWLIQLKDPMSRARSVRRLEKAERGLLGDVAPVGEGVCGMREHFGAGSP